MRDQARQVLDGVLRLPLDERAEVTAEILPPETVKRMWADEITRRAERALRGESVGRDADEVLTSIEAKLRHR